ncbi:MAG TPA: MBL fold metallo-hydrolase [Armatimonadota bacterium]|jgi:glyoxylase-like metal-dependent hydrolase (beta-lactamase superfamily II)
MEFEEGQILRLADGVHLRNAVDNCLWADLGNGAVVVDTLEDPGLAPRIEQYVHEITGQQVRWVINTHWDEDHIAGNPYFASRGATIIAHESCGPATDARDGQPDVTFGGSYVLEGDGREARIEWLGGTHTPADSVVYLPWAKVLHVADLFGWGLAMQRGDTPERAARTDEVLGRILSYEAEIVVCGHGPVLTQEHVRRYLNYFRELTATVPRLAAEGRSLEQIQAAFPPPEDMADWWRFVDWKHQRNVERMALPVG